MVYEFLSERLENDSRPPANHEWSLTASHEMREMLVDPCGDRQTTGDSPQPQQGRVSFLVEVCDPCEAADFAYSVNSVLVSDFYTPNYFDPVTASGVRYSYTGAITKPGQVLRGGYLSWKDATSGHWWQETWFDGGQPTVRDIGPANARAGSIRAFIDRMSGQYTINAIARGRVNAVRAGMTETQAQRSMGANATRSMIKSEKKNDPIMKMASFPRRGACIKASCAAR